MKIDIRPDSDNTGMLEGLAKFLNTDVVGGKVIIPGQHGQGFVHGFNFGPELRMMVSNYQLNYELHAIRNRSAQAQNMLVIRFQNILGQHGSLSRFNASKLPSVQITTQSLNLEVKVLADTWVSEILIVIDAAYLSRLINAEDKNPVLENILANKQPLLFEQFIFNSSQKTAVEMVSENVPAFF